MKSFILQVDCLCDDCGEELSKGTTCYLDDRDVICQECYNERQNDNNLEQRYEENNEEDNEEDSGLVFE
jgi:hypothetical protein